MNESEQTVLNLTQKLESLKRRLDELDAERARVKLDFDVCMSQLASAASRTVPPPEDSSTRSQILWALQRYDDRPLSPMDISDELQHTDRRDHANVRTLLARMTREGIVRRLNHGRYLLQKG
jgi:hypothetical protein